MQALFTREPTIENAGSSFRVENLDDSSSFICIHVPWDMSKFREVEAVTYRMLRGQMQQNAQCPPIEHPQYIFCTCTNTIQFSHGEQEIHVTVKIHENLKDDRINFLSVKCRIGDSETEQTNTQWFQFLPQPDAKKMESVTRLHELVQNLPNGWIVHHPTQGGTSMQMTFKVVQNDFSTDYTIITGSKREEATLVNMQDWKSSEKQMKVPFRPISRVFFDGGLHVVWGFLLYRNMKNEWWIKSIFYVYKVATGEKAHFQDCVHFPGLVETRPLVFTSPHESHGAAAISVRSPFVFPSRRRGGN